MRRIPTTLTVGLLLLTAVPAFSASAADRGNEPFMRGVVVSCPRAGQIWGTEEMTEALTDIRSLGVDSIAIHPYAWVGKDGAIRHRPAAETGYLDEAVRRMRAAGVRMLWKPHLGYWGSFDWRGSIEFGEDEAAWQRFFGGYRDFIVDQAKFAERHQIGLFSIGIEYERTVHREADWRAVIAAVRAHYSGRITYAANWDGLERVPFWDALDVIGVHAYFPLSHEQMPGRDVLIAGWAPHLADLGAMARRLDKPVVFAEIGYNRAADAASRPWQHGTDDSAENRQLRRLLMEVALERIEQEQYILGMFWWKWMPGGRSGRDFSLKEAEARQALNRFWVRSEATSPRVTAD